MTGSGASSEPGRKLLYQLELQLEELETAASENGAIASSKDTTVHTCTRAKPVRGPLLDHLPRERLVVPAPTTCPFCGGK
jgi:transposase